MSDYNSSLPVRTQNNGDVVSFIADGTTSSQLMGVDSSGRITIKLDDGSGNLVTSQVNGAQRALDVGINVAGVQIDPRSIRALTAADVVTANQGGTWTVGLSAGANNIGSVNQGTSPWVVKDQADGSATGGTAGSFSMLTGGIFNTALPTLTNGQQASFQFDSSGRLIISPLTVASVIKVDLQDGSGNAISSTAGALNVGITNALPAGTNTIGSVKITDGTNTVAVAPASTPASATQAAEVVALSPNSPLPAGTNAIGSVLANLQVGSAAVSATNPVPVTLSTSAPGTAIQNYQTSVALAAGASVTLTYTVATGHTFNLERVWASASGKIKAIVQNGATSIFAGFNSTANPNIDMTIISPPTIAAAGTVNVIITNEDKAAFDVYATIEGNQN